MESHPPPSEPSDALDHDHLRLGGCLPKRLGFRVLGGRPPRLRLLHRRELDDDKPLRRPVPLQRLGLSAADDETPSEFRECREHHRPIIRVPHGILDLHLHDDVAGHRQRPESMTRFSMKNSIMRCGFTFECPRSGPTCTSKLFPACWSALISCSELDGWTLLSAVP